MTSATGAIHAVRRELYRAAPSGVSDDFWISSNVLAQGRRLVFAPDANAFEPAAASSEREFRRKVLLLTRGLRSVWRMRRLLNPLEYYSVQLFSHKASRRRLLVPLVLLLPASPLLWSEGLFYRLATLGQGACCGLAAVETLTKRRRGLRPLALPLYFCTVNVACLVATWNVLRGQRIDSWSPEREPVAALSGSLDGPARVGGRRS